MCEISRLKERIRLSGLKKYWLAGESGIQMSTLSRLLSGKSGKPRPETLARIEAVLKREGA